MTVRERLLAWFKWRGISQRELGEKLGITQAGVSHLLKRTQQPTFATMDALERVMGEAREDGSRWEGEPIRAREWLPDAPSADADAAPPLSTDREVA